MPLPISDLLDTRLRGYDGYVGQQWVSVLFDADAPDNHGWRENSGTDPISPFLSPVSFSPGLLFPL